MTLLEPDSYNAVNHASVVTFSMQRALLHRLHALLVANDAAVALTVGIAGC